MGNQDTQDRNWTNSFKFKAQEDKRGDLKQQLCDFNQIPGPIINTNTIKYSTLNISSKNYKKRDECHEDEGDLSKKIFQVYGPIARIIDEKLNKILALVFDIKDMIKIQRESTKIGTFCQKYQELVKNDEISSRVVSNGHGTGDMDNIMTIGLDFLDYLSFSVTHILGKQYIARIENKIQVLAMEYLSYIVFGKRLGLLSIDPEVHIEKFLNAREDFISQFKNRKCSKHFSTTLVNEFIHSTYESEIVNMFTEELYNNSNSTGILNYLLEKSEKSGSGANQVLNLKDKIKLTLNFVFSGTEYISNLILFLLYKLWENDVIQSRLFCHSQSQIDVEYFTACFKEALRLNPSKKNFARRVESDVTVQGFRIPKGTVVVNEFELACQDLKQFFQPGNFLPERWLINNGGHFPNDPTEEMEFFWENNFYYSDIISWKDIFNLSAQIVQAYKMEFIDFKLEVNEANLLYCVNESSKVKIERF